jgi:hypothetical protein
MNKYLIVNDQVVVIHQPEYEQRTWRDSVCDFIELCYHTNKAKAIYKQKQKIKAKAEQIVASVPAQNYSQYDFPSVFRKERSC